MKASECMICGGDGGHLLFLGKPCPAGLPDKGPLWLANEALKAYREAKKTDSEIRELKRIWNLR